MNPNATFFMGFATYKDYLKSRFWKDKKEWVFYQDEIRNGDVRTGTIECEKCKKIKPFRQMTLHHLNYNCVGSERKEDLMIVCNNCHREIHEEEKIK